MRNNKMSFSVTEIPMGLNMIFSDWKIYAQFGSSALNLTIL
jgi:hypothetical protein